MVRSWFQFKKEFDNKVEIRWYYCANKLMKASCVAHLHRHYRRSNDARIFWDFQGLRKNSLISRWSPWVSSSELTRCAHKQACLEDRSSFGFGLTLNRYVMLLDSEPNRPYPAAVLPVTHRCTVSWSSSLCLYLNSRGRFPSVRGALKRS